MASQSESMAVEDFVCLGLEDTWVDLCQKESPALKPFQSVLDNPYMAYLFGPPQADPCPNHRCAVKNTVAVLCMLFNDIVAMKMLEDNAAPLVVKAVNQVIFNLQHAPYTHDYLAFGILQFNILAKLADYMFRNSEDSVQALVDRYGIAVEQLDVTVTLENLRAAVATEQDMGYTLH